MGTCAPEVDQYIEAAAAFARPILRHVRACFHRACPDIEETIKWGFPYFVKDGMVGGMSAFKAHVSVGFWNADRLTDPEGLMAKVGGNEMAAFKVGSLDDLPAEGTIIGWVREAVALNESGYKRPMRTARKDPALISAPDDLAAAMDRVPAAQATWDGFAYSHRKEYVDWIVSAKRDATRDQRVAQAVEWMSGGKRRNWKYEQC